MHLLTVIAIISISVIIFWEDFKTRSVHVFLFPLLGIAGFLNNMLESNFVHAVQSSLINFCISGIQAIVLFIYFRYLKKTKAGISSLIGSGDALFLLMCCLLFEPVYFLWYYSLSLLFTLALHYVFIKHEIYSLPGNTVALAGWQALFLVIIQLISLFVNKFLPWYAQ
jgi:hypothetical protein